MIQTIFLVLTISIAIEPILAAPMQPINSAIKNPSETSMDKIEAFITRGNSNVNSVETIVRIPELTFFGNRIQVANKIKDDVDGIQQYLLSQNRKISHGRRFYDFDMFNGVSSFSTVSQLEQFIESRAFGQV